MSHVNLSEKLVFTNKVIGNTVFMLLNKGIGPDKEDPAAAYIDGSRFANELYDWKGQGKKLVVKINTPGGRVTQGWDIIDAVRESEADTFNTGIAYSMGGMVLMSGKNRRAYDYSSTMIHAPRGGSEEYLKFVKAQFKTLLEGRTKLTAAEIEEIMKGEKDFVFTAQQALEKGIIDEIVPSSQMLTPPTNASAKSLYNFFNNYSENSNEPDMDFKEILAKLTGKNSEAESIVAVTEMKGKIDALAAVNATLTTEVEALKKENAKIKADAAGVEAKTKAVKLVTDAIAAGKLKDDATKDKFIAMAETNFDEVKTLIDGFGVKKTVSAAAIIDAEGKSKELSYEYLANHDPKKLNEIAENDPELFNKLSDEYIAKQKEGKK